MIATLRTGVPALFLSSVLLFGSCKNEKHHTGYDAKDALSTFSIAEGFTIEMVASEPLIADPVDMEIDEFGRMFVVEMHGYPLDKSGSGKIIQLSDSDGDGKMDKRTVFKDGLILPNSIMRWKKGFLVTDSPALLYLEDKDDDGVAEIVDTVITGFALTNPQHNANNPVYGLDNWIYIAHEGEVSTRTYKEEFGDEGREIVFSADTNAVKLPRNANGRSVRLQPDKKKMEMLSSRCQFGHSFDLWGRLLECDNSNHVIQEVIADRYFSRNKDLVISSSTESLSDHLNAAEVFPITTNPDRQLLTDVGVMTSACGVTTYLGGAFPAPYSNAVFTGEPVSNLVHVDLLKDSGTTFRASRILKEKEFLASTDAWSRPVNFYVGPDGALYVLDYYRKVIESPEWMSEEAIEAGGLYDGYDKGRIYRITAKNGKPAAWMKGLSLGNATMEELVTQLANENFWWRINAQRLLVSRNDTNAQTALRKMAGGTSVAGRLHALWALEGLHMLQLADIRQALRDSVAGIRENAIKLSEAFVQQHNDSLLSDLLQLKNDRDPKVRFQLMLTLGFINDPAIAAVREEMLFHDINDEWMQVAALSAAKSQTSSLLPAVLKRYDENNPAYSSLVERIAAMAGYSSNKNAIDQFVSQSLSYSSTKNANVLTGLASGLRRRDSAVYLDPKNERSLVNTFFESKSSAMRQASLAMLRVNNIRDSALASLAMKRASAVIKDSTLSNQLRTEAVNFLAIGNPAQFQDELKALIDANKEASLQLAALNALSKVKGTAISEHLVSKWQELTPEIRSASINTFLADSNRIAILINAMEQGKINSSTVTFGTSVQLMQNEDEDLRNRARKIFTSHEKEREKVNKEYREALQLTGDAVSGKQIYMQNCAICHRVRGKMGVEIGPDLGTVHNWTKEDVLANILNPNMSIASGFDTWDVQLKSGEKVQGIIAAETSVAITLRNNGQMDRTINRQEIQSINSINSSAMPVGLEKNISKQQMADLLAFLRRNQDFK